MDSRPAVASFVGRSAPFGIRVDHSNIALQTFPEFLEPCRSVPAIRLGSELLKIRFAVANSHAGCVQLEFVAHWTETQYYVTVIDRQEISTGSRNQLRSFFLRNRLREFAQPVARCILSPNKLFL